MRIAIVMYEIWEVGGINQITTGLINGFERAGHSVDYFHASKTGKLRGLDETRIVGSRNVRLKGEQLGYAVDRDVKRFRALVRKYYDMVIFAVPCPHQVKSSVGDDRDWQRLYKVKKPVFVIFHDNLWDKYYEWIEEVSDYIDGGFYTVTNAAIDSLTRFKPKKFAFLPVLLDTTKAKIRKHRKDNIVWLPQQKKWKGFVEFVEAVPKLKYHVDMYNVGILYYDMKKKRNDLWRTAVRRDYYAKTHPGTGDFKLNKHGVMDYHGLVLPDTIPSILERAACSVDLTGLVGGDKFKGQITCSMLEPMLYGCVSVVDASMVEEEWSILYGRDDIVLPILGADSISSQLNRLMKNKKLRKKMARRALEYVRKYHDSKNIVEKIVLPMYRKAIRGRLETDKVVFYKDYKGAMEK